MEFYRKMKRDEYDQLTGTQRAWLIVGMLIAVLFQAASCYALGLVMHQLAHKAGL